MGTSMKRIQKELKMLQKKPISNVDSVTTKGDNILNWVAIICGPKGSPYEGGKWKLDIKLEGYPFKPPTVKFETPIYHPNVNKDTGEPCVLLISKDWSPTKKMTDIFAIIVSMMSSPSDENRLNPEMANMIKADPKKFAATAAAHTAKYAK